MSMTSSKVFIQGVADASTDPENTKFVCKRKGEAKNRSFFATSSSTVDTLKEYQIDTTFASSGLISNTQQPLRTLDSLPTVLSDDCEREPMMKCKSAPMGRDMDKTNTAKSSQSLTLYTMETFATLESLPSTNKVEGKRQFFEPVHLKNTFIDFDDSCGAGHELPMRQRCFGDPGPAKRTSKNETLMEAEYGLTLRNRAARLGKMPQLMSANRDVEQVCTHQSVVGSDMTKSNNCDSHGIVVVPAEQGGFKGRDGNMASFAVYEGNSDKMNVVSGQAPVQPPIIARDVTTLMVCNLPCKLSSEGLRQVVDELGFQGMYDLIYVPKGAKHCMGYGFVNFIEQTVARRFSDLVGTYTFPCNSQKRAYCRAADIQGLQSNLRHISRGNNYRRRAQLPVTSDQLTSSFRLVCSFV